MFKKNTPPAQPAPAVSLDLMKMKQWLFLGVAIAACVGLGGSYYFYNKYQAVKTNPNAEAEKKTAEYVAAIGKLMELPKDETPTVATILDKDKLKDQPFFVGAENEDVLLAYTAAAMKAILYRPSTNKIINVGPITINPTPEAEQPTGETAMTHLRIAYYNGTQTAGLSGAAEKLVKAKYAQAETVALKNASKSDYTTTLIVNLSGTYTKEAADIAALVGGVTGPFPAGEVRPDADILIISGRQP